MQEIHICQPRKKIYNNILETIGGTPLVELRHLSKHPKIQPNTRILVKCEYFNPMGSVKDRVGFNLVYQAIRSGKLKPGMEILEATSGNTGIGLCQAAAVFGFPLTIVMPESMSEERKKIIRAFGANLVLSPKEKGIPGAVELFNKMKEEGGEKYFCTMQFASKDNTDIHHTTANEIWEDTDGKVDCVIAGVGTAGTVVGIAEFLKKKNENIFMVAVEPEESQVLQGKEDKPHGIQGIGDGFIPDLWNEKMVNEISAITTEDAEKVARLMVKYEGIMCGISSGSTVLTALRLATRKEFEGKTIVAIMASNGERYLSTDLYDHFETGTKDEILDSLL